MSMIITLLQPEGEPFAAGTAVALLGDDEVVARAVIAANGSATFDIDANDYDTVAIRIEPTLH